MCKNFKNERKKQRLLLKFLFKLNNKAFKVKQHLSDLQKFSYDFFLYFNGTNALCTNGKNASAILLKMYVNKF